MAEKVSKVNIEGRLYEFLAGQGVTGTCLSAADEYIKNLEGVSEGAVLVDGMILAVQFAHANTYEPSMGTFDRIRLRYGDTSLFIVDAHGVYASGSDLWGDQPQPTILGVCLGGNFYVLGSGSSGSGGGGGAVCETESTDPAKVAAFKDYVLQSGNTFQITFENANTSASALTLDVNGTGAIPVYFNGSATSSTNYAIPAGTFICRYNGTNYYIDTGYAVTQARNANFATYSNYSRQGAYCTTAGGTQAKTASMTGFVLQSGVTFPITFANSNSYDGKITLNVNSTGAKDLYINNAVSSSSNKTLPAGTYICWYNGTVYYIDTGYVVLNARNAGYATSAGSATTADSAGKLTTARKVWVKLGTASTSETKDFSGDTAIPVSGTLPVANGGTGQTSLSNVTVGKATTSDYSRQGAYCTTAGGTQAKVAGMPGFVLQGGVTFPITFTNSNSYNGTITLSINGIVARSIYINNNLSSSSNKTLPAGTYLCHYSNSSYWIDTTYAVTKARYANSASSADIATTASHIPTEKTDNIAGAIWVQ